MREKRRASFEYGHYGNYTTVVAEEKISALEGAESTILMASGMCVSTVLLIESYTLLCRSLSVHRWDISNASQPEGLNS
ncbi:cystathionine gamma-synthase 1, chloroplastic [Olea europaea subsp. europaea]|uniref:Cystathionine gamma-synthase 1, chloroplastic n=1 Tax=Olea europaea subsp. europaea TaxID=158383 RepID=A0A8S0UCH8_OLEEU|nr:cystathionine gamma-synthase 1, chloroplastic [Olea europaea subsp. europaea]